MRCPFHALDGKESTGRYSYLGGSERKNIQKILAETLQGAPASWKQGLAVR